MPPTAKFTVSLLLRKSLNVLIGDWCAMVMTRGSEAALPIHDIFARSNLTPGVLPDQLIVDQAGIENSDRQSVGLGGVDGIGADHMARAGNVFHHKRGAGQMLLHELRNQSAVKCRNRRRARSRRCRSRSCLCKNRRRSARMPKRQPWRGRLSLRRALTSGSTASASTSPCLHGPILDPRVSKATLILSQAWSQRA